MGKMPVPPLFTHPLSYSPLPPVAQRLKSRANRYEVDLRRLRNPLTRILQFLACEFVHRENFARRLRIS